MLSPSTAPRWKRQTRTGRWRAVEGGGRRSRPSAARAKKSGSSPTLKRAIPPDFTNTRLDMVIADPPKPPPPFTALHRPPPPLLSLKLRSAYCEADGEGTRLRGIADACQLASEHLLRVLGHRPTQDLLVDHADQLVGVPSRNDGVEHDGHARQLPGRQRHGGIHPIEQRTAVHPCRFPFRIPVGSDVEIKRLAEARHDLRQTGRGVGLGGDRPR